MKLVESYSYLSVEMHITEIMEKLDSLKRTLIEYAEAHLLQHDQPLLDLEETIDHINALKKNLNKVDLDFYEKSELQTTCKLAG